MERVTRIFYVLFLVATVVYFIVVLSRGLGQKERLVTPVPLSVAIATPIVLGIVSFFAGYFSLNIARKIGLVGVQPSQLHLTLIHFFKGLLYHSNAGLGLSVAMNGLHWVYTLPFFGISFTAVVFSYPSERKIRADFH